MTTQQYEVEELIGLNGIVVAVVRVLEAPGRPFEGRLELMQDGRTLTAASEAWQEMDKPAARPKKGARRGSAKPPAEEPAERIYLAPFGERSGARDLDPRKPVESRLHEGRRLVGEKALELHSVAPEYFSHPELSLALAAIFQDMGRGDIAALLGSIVTMKPIHEIGPFSFDRGVAGPDGLVVEGWLANFAERRIHLVTSDLRHWVSRGGIVPKQRKDVHDHLRGINVAGDSDEHGFVAVVPVDAPEADQEFYLVEHDEEAGRATFYGPAPLKPYKNDVEALQAVRFAFGDIQSLPRELVGQVYRPLLAVPKNEARARRFHFGPPRREDGEGVTSVIIPFYGDGFFLNCVHHLQRVLDDSFELILVVDDARIWQEIHGGLNSRSTAIKVPTVLLQNQENYGYGRANNLGFLACQGDVVLLMNSDIMVLDAEVLKEASEAIRARRRAGGEVVVGFSLLYEDDTIQHIGMEFPRSSLVGNMHLADHPMKGLPFSLYRGEDVRSVPAATAALLALSSDLYRRLGGFDVVYERGDFEDADLCLRARQLGAEVEVLVRPGIYHLERQSIPNMGDNDLRGMVTYMNCVEFNRRWEKRLAQPFEASQPKPVARIGRKPGITVRKRSAV